MAKYLILIIIALVAVIMVENVIHHYERKDLYNRIMSKDLRDYKGEKVKRAMSAHERVMRRWKKRNEQG